MKMAEEGSIPSPKRLGPKLIRFDKHELDARIAANGEKKDTD